MNIAYETVLAWDGKRWRDRYKHRVIWEECNGPIPKGMVVHHIDGDRRNNDISNLKLVTRAEHSHIHKVLFNINKSHAGKTNAEIYGPEKAESIRTKLSDKMKVRTYTEERNRNVSKGLMGHHVSEESRIKMSDAAKKRKRKPWSEETKKKMSEAAFRRHARDKEGDK